MGEHALLGASSAHRWLHCPPSARLEEQFPESRSEFAAEGSFAHSLSELKLKKYLKEITPKKFKKDFDELKKDRFYSAELDDYVETYVAQVVERIEAARKISKDTMVLLEEKLDFSNYVPEGFGTGDVVIICDSTIEVIDLKYGKGVPVSALDNPQIMLYGIGAYELYGFIYGVENVKMTIMQPRLDSISTFELTTDALLLWAETHVKPIADLAINGEGEYDAGSHCKFCRAKTLCKARADSNLDLLKHEFKKPDLLTNDDVSEILGKCSDLASWVADITEYALAQAMAGHKWNGWKLVEGRSNRAYINEDRVAQVLREENFGTDELYNMKLLGITAMEKLLGKSRFSELLEQREVLIRKAPGKPTLAPETDKRPELNSVASAAADFLD